MSAIVELLANVLNAVFFRNKGIPKVDRVTTFENRFKAHPFFTTQEVFMSRDINIEYRDSFTKKVTIAYMDAIKVACEKNLEAACVLNVSKRAFIQGHKNALNRVVEHAAITMRLAGSSDLLLSKVQMWNYKRVEFLMQRFDDISVGPYTSNTDRMEVILNEYTGLVQFARADLTQFFNLLNGQLNGEVFQGETRGSNHEHSESSPYTLHEEKMQWKS